MITLYFLIIAWPALAIEHKVAAVVNDEVITDIDLKKRVALIIKSSGMENNQQSVALILETINATTAEFKSIPSIDRTLASKYHQKLEDIQQWLQLTQWSQKPLEEKVLNNIQNQLFDLKIIDKKGTFAAIVKAV